MGPAANSESGLKLPPSKPGKQSRSHKSLRFMIQDFDRFQEEFGKEEFHLFFDYVAFWMTCYKVADMTVECWMECTDDLSIERVDNDQRWMYINKFMEFAQHGDKECKMLLDGFAGLLPEILANNGAQSGLDKAEGLSGLEYEGVRLKIDLLILEYLGTLVPFEAVVLLYTQIER
jgi:hypothetical protein